MIQFLAKKFVCILAECGLITEESLELYELGTDVILSSALTAAAVMLIGTFLRNKMGAVLFLLCFSIIRNYSGGYHASTRTRCFFISVASYLATFGIVVLTRAHSGSSLVRLSLFMFALADMVFYWKAPVENKNKRLPQDWKKRNRKKTFLAVAFWQTFAIILLQYREAWSIQISGTIIVIVILLLAVRRESDEAD